MEQFLDEGLIVDGVDCDDHGTTKCTSLPARVT